RCVKIFGRCRFHLWRITYSIIYPFRELSGLWCDERCVKIFGRCHFHLWRITYSIIISIPERIYLYS
ncbi:hypothetical protein J6590_094918, partial [Homalodisca vitripennis]